MYLYSTMRTYVEDASSSKPTPGGGSIAAAAGALGMSMACMAANFTVGKKKFKAVEDEVRKQLDACMEARDELLRLMDEDTLAYAEVSAACAMPKETAEDKTARTTAIQAALVIAMDAPLKAVRACRAALQATAALVEIANPNLVSDVGVAALLGEAALRAAKLNVEINLRSLKDAALAEKTRAEIEEAAAEGKAHAAAVMAKVVKAVGGTI